MTALLRAILPPAIWFACLSVAYGLVTLACARDILSGVGGYVALGVIVAGIVVLALDGCSAAGRHRSLTAIAFGLSVLSILATLWLLVPLFVLRSC